MNMRFALGDSENPRDSALGQDGYPAQLMQIKKTKAL